jgi:hypothetical protein
VRALEQLQSTLAREYGQSRGMFTELAHILPGALSVRVRPLSIPKAAITSNPEGKRMVAKLGRS